MRFDALILIVLSIAGCDKGATTAETKFSNLSEEFKKLEKEVSSLKETARLTEYRVIESSSDMSKARAVCDEYSKVVGEKWVADFTSYEGRLSFYCFTFSETIPVDAAELYVFRYKQNKGKK